MTTREKRDRSSAYFDVVCHLQHQMAFLWLELDAIPHLQPKKMRQNRCSIPLHVMTRGTHL